MTMPGPQRNRPGRAIGSNRRDTEHPNRKTARKPQTAASAIQISIAGITKPKWAEG